MRAAAGRARWRALIRALGGPARTRAPALGAVLVLAMLGAIGWWPPMAGPGYEIALAAGLLGPSVAAVTVALELRRRQRPGPESFLVGLRVGVRLALLAYATTLVHGLRTGFCDLLDGTVLFLLGPGLGILDGAVVGVFAGLLAGGIAGRRRRTLVAVALALAAPVGSVLLQLGLFYATPMVFAYDPFVGYFSGALYDTVLDTAGLASYRAATVATLVAAYALACHVDRPVGRGGLQLRRRGRGPRWLLPLGACCAIGSVGSVVYGPALGHWQTAGTIAAELGGSVRTERCVVVYDRTIRDDRAKRLARDCEGHLRALAAWFGEPLPPETTVYLFADPGRKRRLMGAAAVSIAKPWQQTIYLHDDGYPHGTLGHELAHVYAGRFGRGPFAIAGELGGWLPNPGLIEGVAVAAAPPRGDLTDAEWAKAMRDIEVLPPLEELFGLSFLGQHSRTAYTAAGAFVGFVRERFGVAAVRRWYGGESFEAITGQSLAAVERAWHGRLDGLSLSEAARRQAKARFDQPGVLARRCPHVVDATLAAAGGLQAAGDCRSALEAYRRALRLDPTDAGARLGQAACWSALDRPERARATLQALAADPDGSQRDRDRAHERLGDLALRAGDLAAARRYYELAAEHAVDEDRLRTLDVKIYVCTEPRGRQAVVALLIGTDRWGPNPIEALDRIGAWRAEAPEQGLPDYLLARQYLGVQRYGLAAERLDDALAKGFALGRVHTEALRLRLRVACALGDDTEAEAAFAAYAARPGVPLARRRAAEHLLGRCTGPSSGRRYSLSSKGM